MINKGMYTSDDRDWETPQWLFNDLNNIFNFDIDVCADENNTKCSEFYGDVPIGYDYDHKPVGTVYKNGLMQDWAGKICWMNPPYGREVSKWVTKAKSETNGIPNTVVVGLLPARLDTKWFHDNCLDSTLIGFIKGRLKFSTYNKRPAPAPFPSMVVVWGLGNIPFSNEEVLLTKLPKLNYIAWMELSLLHILKCVDEIK